ncbi:MAG TPA: DUF1987 domain-containing protein [Tenuifilaceae bacterium]|nr:DUF1987 domain-containing protein [Tenuifilaceae bacterium]HRX30903.1 DUF1987 domain-containing protein [Tenuifilaceae bacterium]
MEPLYIEPSEFTPRIFFDPASSVFEISGFSRPENVVGFYKPLIKWLEDFEDQVLSKNTEFTKSNLVVNLKLTYFNSASSKFLLDILMIFMKFHSKGNNVEINWFYDEDDDEIFESGEEISEMISFPFNFIPITPGN